MRTLERPAALQYPCDEGEWDLPDVCEVGMD